MTLLSTYKGLIDEIVTQLKTNVPELADTTDLQGKPDSHVMKWNGSRTPKPNDYEVEVKAGNMSADSFTTRSSDNTFEILCDLIYYATDHESGFDNCMTVAEKIYDLFHLTTINSRCRNAVVTLSPGDGELSGESLLAVPIRIIVTCKRVIHQN